MNKHFDIDQEAQNGSSDAMEMLERSTRPVGWTKENGLQDEVYDDDEMEEYDCIAHIRNLRDARDFVLKKLKRPDLKAQFFDAYDDLAKAAAGKLGDQ